MSESKSQRTFVLTYFPIRGRGEMVKLALEDAGANYTVEYPENWPKLKEDGNLLFGQIPALKDSSLPDVWLVQSNAILRHLARTLEGNYYGSNEKERVLVDMYIDAVEDIRLKYLKLIYVDQCSDDAKATFLKDYLPGVLAPFEKAIKDTNIVGEPFTIADLSFLELVEVLVALSPSSIEAFPQIKAWHSRAVARSQIAAYFASERRAKQINNNGKGQ